MHAAVQRHAKADGGIAETHDRSHKGDDGERIEVGGLQATARSSSQCQFSQRNRLDAGRRFHLEIVRKALFSQIQRHRCKPIHQPSPTQQASHMQAHLAGQPRSPKASRRQCLANVSLMRGDQMHQPYVGP